MRPQIVCLVFLLLVACASEVVENVPNITDIALVPEPQVPNITATSVIIESSPTPVPSPPEVQAKPEIIVESPVAPGPSSLGTRVMKTGVFDGKKVSGSVTLFKKSDGLRVVSIDGFHVEPAANLHVYLVEDVPADGVDLGRLVSKQGSQQYNVPSDIPTTKINSVAIYNPEKDVVWGFAALS